MLAIIRSGTWNIRTVQDPYRVLEILQSTSLPMIEKTRRTIAFQSNPDWFQEDKMRADDMMKLVNEAFDRVRKENKRLLWHHL